jgi:glycosyltransferase involved in cell wall biosynthesis
MKIAILADHPYPLSGTVGLGRAVGVGATWLSQLADEFGKNPSIDVTWISFLRREKPSRYLEFTRSGVKFILCPGIRTSLDVGLGYLPARIKLRRLLGKVKPDLVHAWGLERAYPAAIGLKIAPGVLSIQGLLGELTRVGCLPQGWQWKLQASFEARWVRAARVVTCESPWALEKCIERHRHPDVRRIEYGVHSSFYDVRWNPAETRPIILFVGNLTIGKGFDRLIEAVRNGGRPPWELRVAGEGPLAAAAAGVPGITLLGNLDWEQLQAEMAAAWCLAAPTLADTGPMVVKEARVVGMPVVGSRNGGLRDYIRHGENGLHLSSLEPGEIRRTLDHVAADFARVLEMGRSHHHADREMFHPERVAPQWISLYREILAGKSSK